MKTLLFPSSFFDRNQVDEDLKTEYNAALQTKEFDILLFDYDAWFNNRKLKLSSIPEKETSVIYRGWMMTPEHYSAFYQQLRKQNISLVTTPEMYEEFHLFPHIYPKIKEDTPRILTVPLYQRIHIQDVLKTFSKFIVKDFVKSVKDSRFPKYFDTSFDQAQFDQYMKDFYQYRGDLLTKGICIKEYVDLKRYEKHTNEVRVFYFDQNIISVCQNSDQPENSPMPPVELIQKYQFLDSRFYTIDYAELKDGSWIIIETGDGSVSGIPPKQDPEEFYISLCRIIKKRKDVLR